MRLLHFGQFLPTLTQHLKWVSAAPYLQLYSLQESPLSLLTPFFCGMLQDYLMV
jgi:hypothetical protein